jgi:dienelactone hydrolase
LSLAAAAAPFWDVAALSRPPQVFPATNVADGVEARFFAGLSYRGQPTRVFAFYGLPTNATSRARVPGVVLVHGGGGTAFAEWVRLWTGRGYAAIAMDLCGSVPVGTYGKWERHADGGPPGWGGFDQIDAPPGDQWTYHAVADVLLAHSFLRSLPEVDARRIGLTGISWGGYLTCIAAGVDRRFRCAVPVYGCGFLGANSAWLGEFERLGPERAERWLAWWDPAAYLDDARLPILWLNGSNDFAYPMDSWQKSYRRAPGPRTVCLKVRMPHAHGGAGENPEEIRAFMDARLRDGPPLARVTGQGRAGLRVWATCQSRGLVQRAELNFTRSAGRWQDRLWETIPAAFDSRRGRAEAGLPADAAVWYVNFVDSRGLVVSTEHEVIAPSVSPPRVAPPAGD